MSETCGAWGGCALPAGHNRGQVDIPSNHAPAPVDWPARFRKAADEARARGWPSEGNLLLAIAGWMTLDRPAVKAVGRALLGEDS